MSAGGAHIQTSALLFTSCTPPIVGTGICLYGIRTPRISCQVGMMGSTAKCQMIDPMSIYLMRDSANTDQGLTYLGWYWRNRKTIVYMVVSAATAHAVGGDALSSRNSHECRRRASKDFSWRPSSSEPNNSCRPRVLQCPFVWRPAAGAVASQKGAPSCGSGREVIALASPAHPILPAAAPRPTTRARPVAALCECGPMSHAGDLQEQGRCLRRTACSASARPPSSSPSVICCCRL